MFTFIVQVTQVCIRHIHANEHARSHNRVI